MKKCEYDIIIFGASSFVGQILTREFSRITETSSNLRWAIAGRSTEKLNALLSQLDMENEKRPDILVADSLDYESLVTMCKRTRVVVSTVGPFALYGENLVRACVEEGIDHCDITGESHWVIQMISRYQTRAVETGARIVHSCGFDSMPSDLGVYYLQNQAKQKYGHACQEINTRVVKLKGRLSGGTYASLMNIGKEFSENPAVRKAIASPYCFCPCDHPFSIRQTVHKYISFDPLTDAWIAPFIMEGINVRTVHRSNVLLGMPYGDSFRYDEALVTGKGRKGRKRGSRMAIGLWLLMLCTTVPLLRSILEKWFLPKPGEGPSPEEQENGKFSFVLFGDIRGYGKIRCKVSGDKDPGYGSTAKMLAQAALCLAEDFPKDSSADATGSDAANKTGGGFWTPASLLGNHLIERLIDNAGLTFAIIEEA